MKIPIVLEYSEQDVLDILTTATEGAIDYWADVRNAYTTKDGYVFAFNITYLDEEDKATTKIINQSTIKKGIKTVLEDGFECSTEIKGWLLVKEIDADVADCIIQAALFGELVYG